MADVSGLGALVNLAESALEGGADAAEAGGVLGSLGGLGSVGGLGSLLGGASSLDPECLAVDLAGKLLGLNETDLGIIKVALGAATGDPLAIAGGLAEGIGGLAKGESPFAPFEALDDALAPSNATAPLDPSLFDPSSEPA